MCACDCRENRGSGNGYDEVSESSTSISQQWTRMETLPTWARDTSTYSSGYISYVRGGVTLGVHTIRLLRTAFLAWQGVTVDMRMVGKTAVFSGLEFFMQQVQHSGSFGTPLLYYWMIKKTAGFSGLELICSTFSTLGLGAKFFMSVQNNPNG